MIGSHGTVDAGRAAEFGDRHDRGVLPTLAQALLEFVECAVEAAEQIGQSSGRAAFVDVRIPAIEGERGDARPVIGRHQAGRALRGLAHAGGAVQAALRLHRSGARGIVPCHPVGIETFLQGHREQGIAVVVEVEHARRQAVAGLRQCLGRPAEHGCGAPDDQWGRRTDRQPAEPRHPLARRQAFQGAVQPARGDMAGTGKAAFQHILAIEMRTLPVAGRGGVHHGGLPVAKQPREDRHGRIDREEAVQR